MLNLIVRNNKNLFNLKIYYNGIEIGNSVSGSINRNSSMIYNINIKSKFQGFGYGNYLLQSTENLLTFKNQNLRNIILVAYQKDNIGNNLINFYKKNNYEIIKDNYNTYDDGENIYNLYKMIKFLK